MTDLNDSLLQLPTEEMRQLGYKVVDMLVEHSDELTDKPVTRKESRAVLEKLLREPPPEVGTPPGDVLELLQRAVFSNIMHLDHPRFFGFIPGPGSFVGAMGDALASGFNVFSGTWLESSGPTQVELVTVDWLRQLCGLPDSTSGLFVSGGSLANLTGLAVARRAKLGDAQSKAVVYCSDQTHSSIDRGLAVLGFAPGQVQRIPSDDQFRMIPGELQRYIGADRAAGRVPFCVVANVGTTNTGAVDPLPELAEICHSQGLWLHGDGAYGAAAALTERGRQLLAGLEQVDSLVLDPHKWLFQPYGIGCILVRDGALLRDTFHILPDYLADIERERDEVNMCDHGIELTRPFRALKLWMSLKMFGLQAFREAIQRGMYLAEQEEIRLRESALWELVSPAQLGIVVFRYVARGLSGCQLDQLNMSLVDRLIDDRFALVSSTQLGGRTALRMCTINPRTTRTDINETIGRLEALAVETRGGWEPLSR